MKKDINSNRFLSNFAVRHGGTEDLDHRFQNRQENIQYKNPISVNKQYIT